ncbi:ABC transporter substrate-binding protein [Aliiroseovarius sp. 2305UL8-7]|uniref:ABC transporter substrate-binding protein n=1 Tax=Aliiroseovarius conchicola TaxID=3121637 RepID=UPI0035290422
MTFNYTIKASMLALMTSVAAPALADSDVSHNWNSDGEAAAMRVFRDKYVEMGGTWKDTSFPDTEASISSVKTRVIGGTPPMALQSSLGGVMREFAESGLLQNMDDVASAGGWAGNLSESLAEVGKYDGNWVAAPVFVDVINWLYTNNDALAAADVQPPNSWDDFKASLPKLKEAGIIPLAVGGQSWQEAILFDHVLLAVGGAALYEGLLTGDSDVVKSDAVLKALEEMGSLKEFTDEGKSGRSWNDTNTLMLSNKAAYFFMGPWAAGGYGDMGPEGGKWSCRLTPWDNSLTVVADGFQFIAVEDDADKAAQALFANAVMDPATQVAAAKAKGTLPATNKADPADFDGCPAKAVTAMGSAVTATHWNGRAIDVGTAVKDNVSAFWNGSIDAQTAHQNLIAALVK